MRVRKSTYRDRKGRRRQSRNWYIEIPDLNGRMRSVTAFTDRAASEQLGRRLEQLAARRAAGERLDREESRWIERLPERIRRRICELGYVDPTQLAGTQVLAVLLEDFRANLAAKGRTEKHVRHVVGRARRVIEGCGFVAWSDLDAREVQRHLASLRDDGMSPKTSNHLLASVRQFTRWAVAHRLASEDPLAVLEPVNARVDRRRVRRPFTWDELRRMLRAVEDAPERYGLSGWHRGLLYRLAAETGFRASEVRALRVSSFDLDSDVPIVRLPAEATKNREEASLPLRADTAARLGPLLVDRRPWDPAFPMTRGWRPARVLREDLARAGIAYEDENGHVRDFHALRGAFVTALVKSGANPKVVQMLARHSTTELTLGIYAKLGAEEERRAVESLPSLDLETTGEVAAGTGTSDVLPSCLPEPGTAEGIGRPPPAPATPSDGAKGRDSGVVDGGGGGNRTRVLESSCAGRLRA